MYHAVGLLLPGMTLNATIFPEIGMPTVEAPFCNLRLSRNGDLPSIGSEPGSGMDIYRGLLDAGLRSNPAWRAAAPRVVVAHSFGGMLALAWWLHHRDTGLGRVDGLVLIATTAGPMFAAARVRICGVGALDWRLPLTMVMPWWNRPWITRIVKGITSFARPVGGPVDFRRLQNHSDLAIDLAGWRNTDWRAMRSFRLAMMGFDVRDRLGEITVPTVVLHGSEDPIFRPAVGKELSEGIPNAEWRLVVGARHGLPLTHGSHVVAAVRDVLAAGRGGSGPIKSI